MDSLILLFLCIILGVILKRTVIFPSNGHQALNAFVIYLSLPAVALYYVPKIPLSLSLLYPISLSWLSLILSFIIFSSLGKHYNWPKPLTGCLILTAGLGNTSFIGFPVLEAIFGSEALATGVLIDQPGSFLALSTLGIFTASYYSGGNNKLKPMIKKVIFFPPFLAFVFAFSITAYSLEFPKELQSVFQKLSYTVVPLSLVSVGLQLQFRKRSVYWKYLLTGLFYKLLLFPTFILIAYHYVFGIDGELLEICVMEAGMAPMITAAIIASSNRLKSSLASMMISYGIPASFVTLSLWYMILKLI